MRYRDSVLVPITMRTKCQRPGRIETSECRDLGVVAQLRRGGRDGNGGEPSSENVSVSRRRVDVPQMFDTAVRKMWINVKCRECQICGAEMLYQNERSPTPDVESASRMWYPIDRGRVLFHLGSAPVCLYLVPRSCRSLSCAVRALLFPTRCSAHA